MLLQVVRGKVDAFLPIEKFGSVSVREPETVVTRVTNAVTQCRANVQSPCPPGHYDGVFTLIEDHGPLVARIAHRLGLPGSPIDAAIVSALAHENPRLCCT
jgi:hypothetical protein